ncbi:Kdo hydroxylase family protein [Undibacterium terreum]|uniref:3-deoxy-D-manno-oct-2-ulosonic acid (Kdo) hydroxylase n=1 Tax=Undibacterium terreum TaxID=1224302 RepID=A0A916U9B6_9BURK|nr:Kdo hydroxylase family protein [Undibacterium terreum]GGC65337.1 hypothetical protein GCM10011396_10410 [Undibacterium terreum]
MSATIVEFNVEELATNSAELLQALEAGKVLYTPAFPFATEAKELSLFKPEILAPKSRNVSLGADDRLKGAAGSAETLNTLNGMMYRYREQAEAMLAALSPAYQAHLQRGATSFRPMEITQRTQSWRADDRRLHIDAFPSRPNRGSRLLRVFLNVNPDGVPRVWRVGESFDDIVQRFMPRLKPYSAWQAGWLERLKVTKSFRTEYDHLMLQLHDAMKADMDYQRDCKQETVKFPPGSAWICFSDQASHAAMSGQFLLEYTAQLPAQLQSDYQASPLAILTRTLGHELV